jgi:hypothetical protein
MEPQTVAPGIAGVRSRRADLHAILVDLEDAIAAAAPGRESAWTEQVRAHVARVGPAFAKHITATEGPDGLFDQVRRRSPRLDGHCRRLAEEHGTITTQLAAVHRVLEEGDSESIRAAVVDLLGQLVRHRQLGADLVYEAYAVDIGGSE